MSNKKRNFEEIISDHMLTILIVILISAVLLIGGLVYAYKHYFAGSILVDHDKWGLFGDYLGGTLNPILSFLALIAILLTIVLQNRQLKIARDEMKESKNALELQRFENTFFEMLRLIGNIVEDITFEVVGEISRMDKGRICFKYMREKLKEDYDAVIAGKTTQPTEYPDLIESAYNKFAERFEHKIGHYFRTLYRLFKFVHESDPDGTLGIDKKHYTGIARALLSSHELVLLFYDCFYKKGAKFAKLIIGYSLFENMEFEKLFDKENHVPLFDKNAYGDEDRASIKINPDVPVHFTL